MEPRSCVSDITLMLCLGRVRRCRCYATCWFFLSLALSPHLRGRERALLLPCRHSAVMSSWMAIKRRGYPGRPGTCLCFNYRSCYSHSLYCFFSLCLTLGLFSPHLPFPYLPSFSLSSLALSLYLSVSLVLAACFCSVFLFSLPLPILLSPLPPSLLCSLNSSL